MYQSSFWDTAAIRQPASFITCNLLRITDWKHTIETVNVTENAGEKMYLIHSKYV